MLGRIQITTDKETAESCGYALIGFRNALASHPILWADEAIISHIITAFATADIVEAQGEPSGDGNYTPATITPDEGTSLADGHPRNDEAPSGSGDRFNLSVIEFIRPNGKKEVRVISVDRDTFERFWKITDLAGHDNHCFTLEDCGAFWNLCFEYPEEDIDGDVEIKDVVCDVVAKTSQDHKPTAEDWAVTVNAALAYLEASK